MAKKIKNAVSENLTGGMQKVGGFFNDFKEFAMKGNVIDMAVGVIIGGAFGKIVSSLVSDIIMPLIGGLTGGFDFKTLVWHVSEAQQIPNPAYEAAKLVNGDLTGIAETITRPAVDVNYGLFIQNFVDFLLIAFSIFLVIRLITKTRERIEAHKAVAAVEAPAEEVAAPVEEVPAKSDEVALLEEIRDLLKTQSKN